MWDIKKFFIFLYVKCNNKLKSGHTIIYKRIPYTHLFAKIYVRKFFSLTFKYIYTVSFLNNKNLLAKIQVLDKKHLVKFEHLPQYSVSKKLIRKR